MEDELLYEDSRITVGESLLLTMAFIMRHKMSLCNCLGQILVKFLSDCISEPRASFLVVCVHGLCFCVCGVSCVYCELFGSCVYNYSGVQKGQSVSIYFLPFLVSFRRFISSLVVLPLHVFVFLSHPICFVLLRCMDQIFVFVFQFDGFEHWHIVIKINHWKSTQSPVLLISALTAFIFNSELVVIVPGVSYTLVA